MGWELRNGRWYLYRNARVNGRPRKEYLAAEGDFGTLMAHQLHVRQQQTEQVREVLRESGRVFRLGVDAVLTASAEANDRLRIVVEGSLVALGYHNHHRGEWRMARNNGFGALMATLQQQDKKPEPLISYTAPENDPEAVELFARARAGDGQAAAAVRKLLADRNWADGMGDLGAQAAMRIMAKATATDEVWKAAILEKVQTLKNDLGWSSAPTLERLLMRRILNGWLAVHVLELQQAMRPPSAVKEREYLDRALSRAQKRYTEAIGALARVRRLNIPIVLAQVNVTGQLTTASGSALPGSSAGNKELSSAKDT